MSHKKRYQDEKSFQDLIVKAERQNARDSNSFTLRLFYWEIYRLKHGIQEKIKTNEQQQKINLSKTC